MVAYEVVPTKTQHIIVFASILKNEALFILLPSS
tara:strand:+ start:17879 stop:17980 length:102 start_codon:yes stop_codon:yes gene_type:complete